MSDPGKLAEAVLLPGFAGTTAPDWLRRRLGEGLGGVVLFGRNVVDDEQVAALTAALRAERDDVVVGIDEEGGDVTRLDVATGSFVPGPLALGAAGDPELTTAVAAALGERLAACGVTVNLAPCADLTLAEQDPIIGVRAFGSDPAKASPHVAAYVTGMQQYGVAACAKHFPGHGAATEDSHVALPVLPRTVEQLREIELVPFAAAIRAGVRSVMSGHLVVRAWGEEPATLNHTALTTVLRGELGFTGTVITDALEMGAVSGAYGRHDGLGRAAVRSLAAGADALCIGGAAFDAGTLDRITAAIVAAVSDGTLPWERLADAAARTAALGTSPVPAPLRPVDDTLGLEAARAALRVQGSPRLSGPPLVVDVHTDPTIAAGPMPWGLGPHLRALVPGTRVLTAGPDDAALVRSAARETGRVVVVTREAHRHPAVLALLAELSDVDYIRVETGVPGPGPVTGDRIDTFGGSHVSLRAAAEYLAS
ncbi:glycoside hydrolase family 3 N-terminal domain-containing protein [Amycolatopsis sp. PS_44_ISF1]|uniref:glycoside hydrolase family 3 protein n=1 Tax=Amycolatopsis sp. PS_44_ISF1 TaxID=2974917 RepID=UPI0028DD960A|nr:glycoside hydrolase family 3 N-terminal domain-containing protein [Amycolatopsis sp. PS_44_ISF1]MDT8912876.1 glycoside hydrolase family 3 protein [Amycolatopsis sp. PS_44_ISF1]